MDTSSALARAGERHRRAAYTAGAGVLARAISLATLLVTMRITFAYLGTERFGLWMTITSLQTFLAFADIGLGNALLNAVAHASGRDDNQSIRQHIDSALLLLTAIAAVLLVAFLLLIEWAPLGRLLNLHSVQALREVRPAIAVFAVCFAADIPVGTIQRVQMGLQLGYVANLWQIVGSLLGLGGLLAMIHWRASLPLLVLAFCGGPLLAKLLNACRFYLWDRRDLLPTLRFVTIGAMRCLGRLAFLFFVLQMAVAVAFQSDYLIVTHNLGPESVTQYAVPQKLFSIISLAIATLIQPLWPAYGEAIARGDGPWVRRTLIASVVGAATLALFVSSALVLLGPQLIHLWVGDKVHAGFSLLLGLGCWAVLDAGGNAVAMFLNGASIVKPQVIIASVSAVFTVLAKIGLIHWWGIDGIPWATALCYLIFTLAPYAIIVPRVVSSVCRPGIRSTG